jgi:hypothetical protein
MKTYCGVEVWLYAFLTSVLNGGRWSASRPGRFTPKERAPWYPLDRRLGAGNNFRIREVSGSLNKGRDEWYEINENKQLK